MPRLAGRGYRRGDIKIHGGTLEDIPSGWELATELIDRAPVGAGGDYVKGQQFGADSRSTQSTTLSNSQVPSHAHGYSKPTALTSGSGVEGSSEYAFNQQPSTTGYSGGSGAHHHGNVDTRQRSTAVIWIRKL